MILDVHNIKSWDQHSIKTEWKSSLNLMENAALSLAVYIHENYASSKFVILCGSGNNGGDGYALARMLFKVGVQVEVMALINPSTGSEDCQTNYHKFIEIGGGVLSRESFVQSGIPEDTVLVDAIFGTGLNRPIEGDLADVIASLNQLPNHKIAIDVPSGMIPDQYDQQGVVFSANLTLTLQCFKKCFLNRENLSYTGEIKLIDIGLSKSFRPQHLEGRLITKSYLENAVSNKKVNSEKRDVGTCLLIGGAKGMAGAIIMAGKAAYRSGCGLLIICAHADNREIIQSTVPEALFISFQDLSEELIQKARSVVIGPGLGISNVAEQVLLLTLNNASENLVLDADAINLYAAMEDKPALPKKTILTPHKRELDRLLGATSDFQDLLSKQKAFSKYHGVILVSKGPYTQITDQLGCLLVNTSGNPALAKGGSGDVLSGIIGGLLCFVAKNTSATALGVFLHGKLADLWVQENSEHSLIPTDLIDSIPKLLKT